MKRLILGCVGLGVIWVSYFIVLVGSLTYGMELELGHLIGFGVMVVVSLPFTTLVRYGWKARRNQEKVGG